MLNTAEQDITKHEAARVAPGPGPSAQQRTAWRSRDRFRPYERTDNSSPPLPHSLNSNHGGSLAEIKIEDVADTVVLILFFPSHDPKRIINDNYWVDRR